MNPTNFSGLFGGGPGGGRRSLSKDDGLASGGGGGGDAEMVTPLGQRCVERDNSGLLGEMTELGKNNFTKISQNCKKGMQNLL